MLDLYVITEDALISLLQSNTRYVHLFRHVGTS